jgi:hypothetical protein
MNININSTVDYNAKDLLYAVTALSIRPAPANRKCPIQGPYFICETSFVTSLSHSAALVARRSAEVYNVNTVSDPKVKVKFILEQATKTQRGSRGLAILFLQLRR